ncbi:1-acyl-sn-glycerol-3-phosphate acyltransferase [Tenuibacillus multivorans]|uniref:1-acyl-sn-glycerol-3-phosphate acyltransferase n=2 Tax=Tenuibacillus multivorans TaxID=237069 RepID=A0A1G9WBG9_9BACI|nr:1-acyl-sn-glycerol-3-phosphate acyltransferase [Tenuibacillus multivorans]
MQRLLLTPIRTYIESRSDIVIERNDTEHMEPPYIILANHVNNWDPLFLNCYVNEPICYIAGEPLFRNPFLKQILEYTGAIRKTKFTNDTSTIRSVIKAKKHNRVIGIFPEGNRNWDGYNEPLIYSTAKLVKLLNIPVVIAKIKGGHISHPRWGDGHRKGKIAISFEKRWDFNAFEQDSINMIHEKLTEALHHDEMAWQKEEKNEYQAKNPAHYLERLLFTCPHCQTPGRMHSNGDRFYCLTCDYRVRYTPYGTFESINQPVYYSTPYDWKNWQIQFLNEYFGQSEWEETWKNCLQDPVMLYVSYDKKPFQLLGKGRLTWEDEQFIFQGKQERKVFPIKETDGMNIQFHHKLDFLYQDAFYRIVFYEPRSSAYKWLQISKLIDQKHRAETRGMHNG